MPEPLSEEEWAEIQQVAEDRGVLNGLISDAEKAIGNEEPDARSALSRLATKAQGYGASVAELQRFRADDEANTAAIVAAGMAPMNTAEAIAALASERDAAVANSAALVDSIMAYHEAWKSGQDLRAFTKMLRLAREPRPGVALLEEHRKALVRARNEGRRQAADITDRRGHSPTAIKILDSLESEHE